MQTAKLITLSVIFTVSISCLTVSSIALTRIINAKSFPKANAIVLYSSYNREYWSRYSPVIKYKYTINSIEYKNDKYSPELGPVNFRLKGELDRFLEKYKKGKIVDIFYDPENPQTSYITTGFSSFSFILLIIGLGTLYVGISISKQEKL